jgi:hypothetical protein
MSSNRGDRWRYWALIGSNELVRECASNSACIDFNGLASISNES